MDVQLHKAAREGDINLLTRFLENSQPDLTRNVTPQNNTALHIAVAFGHQQIVREMIDREPSLISQPNSNGDTPLHIAARADNLTLTKFLTPTLEEGASWRLDGVEASTKENLDGYTALREALRMGKDQVALHLLRFDTQSREVAQYVTEAGESLLYLASEAGLTRVVNEMIDRGNFSTQGRHGQNPLHIAVITGQLGVVKLLKDRAPGLIKEVDDFGKTTLHYASIIGNYDDDGSRKEILKVLIQAEPSLAYKSDNGGIYPLLIATVNAPVIAVETILKHCPDSAELVDLSGRNALHLAVRKNNESTLRSLLKRREFRMLINGPDYAGNTPMHLAAQQKYGEMIELLLKCKHVDLSIKNKEGLTALDICRVTRNKEGLTALDICGYTTEQRLIHDKLKKHGAVPSGQEQWQEMLLMPPPPKLPLPRVGAIAEKLQLCLPLPHAFSLAPELISISSNTEFVTNTLSIVTTLVATVTFAAAFTVPGGYKNDGIGEGLPIFIKNAALKVFLISDSIAFCSSMAATILLVYASANPEDKFLSNSTLNTCAYIAAVAIPATITAFMAGIYMLTSKESLGLTITSILLGCFVPALVWWRGLLEKEKVDSFNAPYYSPSPEELESVIQGEGSFVLNRLQLYEVDWYPTDSDNIIQTESTDTAEKQHSMGGNYVAKTIRAVVESMLQNLLGRI
ncbi:hypothetical protein MRB53_007069 [Persea americana]|uniref:Uncharacterized protein n=1 Tax=Persea americana TaxID=3435 RepID=A0ACC2MIV5_PERAE|nr:hypothetical protein MRB53_007069 [Persea americana]